MITDSQTNLLYLSPLLKDKFPNFSNDFFPKLEEHGVKYRFLEHTKDVWCVDFMPIQVSEDRFVRFGYDPKFLKYKKYIDTRSDNKLVCQQLDYEIKYNPIKLEGGNVVKSECRVICTDRIFKDNETYPKEELLNTLLEVLEVQEVIIVPRQPHDFTGHSDGMVRFVNDNKVLVNDYSGESNKRFVERFYTALEKSGLEIIKLPYSVYGNSDIDDAGGCYVNYLQMGNLIFVPIFERKEDNEAIQIFESVFSNCEVIPVFSNELAKQGGILNCISWNVKS